jgi:hypothetical protein
MNKEIKYNSIQAGPFTDNQNRISFEIPANGVYDLSQSYINLNTQLDYTDDGNNGNGVYVLDLEWDTGLDFHPKFSNASVVKNALIRNSKNGMIENIRRVDQLSNVMRTYGKSVLQDVGKSYEAASNSNTNINLNQYSIYRDINKVGVVKSKQNDIAPIKIALRDIFDFCAQASEIDTGRSGAITVEMELNINKLRAIQRQNSADWPAELTSDAAFEDTTNEGDANQLTTALKFKSLNQSVFYVGQKLLITAQGAGGAGVITDEEAVIDSIVWNTDKTLTIEFEQKWGDIGAGESYTQIEVQTKDVVLGDVGVNVNFGEIALLQLAKTSSDFDTIEYSTFSTEQTNGNGLQNFQRQFQVEADSDAVIIIFPDTHTELISASDISESRLRLDNVDLTDRNVPSYSPLHYDRINASMTQMKRTLRNLAENSGSTQGTDFLESILDGDGEQLIIMAPLVQKLQEKLLQVNLTSAAGVEQITLFKHLPRTFNY